MSLLLIFYLFLSVNNFLCRGLLYPSCHSVAGRRPVRRRGEFVPRAARLAHHQDQLVRAGAAAVKGQLRRSQRRPRRHARHGPRGVPSLQVRPKVIHYLIACSVAAQPSGLWIAKMDVIWQIMREGTHTMFL